MFMRLVFSALIAAVFSLPNAAYGQSTPQEAFEEFRRCWDDLEWDEIKKVCTDEAYQQMIVTNIRSVGVMLQHDLPFESDDLKEMREILQLLFDDYGFDKVDFKDAAIVTIGEISDEEMKKKIETQQKNLKKINQQIKDILAKVEKRKTFDNELLDMCTSNPFLGGTQTLTGAKVKKIEMKDDLAFLRVENDGDITHSVGNAQIVLKVPPRYIRFKKIGQVWKYDGIDEQKTEDASNKKGK